MKTKIVLFLLSITILLSAASNTIDIVNSRRLYDLTFSNGYYYFSALCPNYTDDIQTKELMFVAQEVLRFLDLKLVSGSYDQTYGSYMLADFRVKAEIDMMQIEGLATYLQVESYQRTDLGTVLCVKISESSMSELWSRYARGSEMPRFDLEFPDESSEQVTPSWFRKPPQVSGYIIGIGYYAHMSNVSDLFKNSDYMARLEVINSLGVKIKSHLNDFMENDFELTSFYANQTSSSRISGIYIIKRFYNKRLRIAFSLAAYKL